MPSSFFPLGGLCAPVLSSLDYKTPALDPCWNAASSSTHFMPSLPTLSSTGGHSLRSSFFLAAGIYLARLLHLTPSLLDLLVLLLLPPSSVLVTPFSCRGVPPLPRRWVFPCFSPIAASPHFSPPLLSCPLFSTPTLSLPLARLVHCPWTFFASFPGLDFVPLVNESRGLVGYSRYLYAESQ
eukprot:GILI01026891.1.p1 GENE.GILI01026891.1~~GILI01026891.1.p1  ORF type:complete len:182 (+),score=12.39 GILI01026891.1:127-672(+)